MSVQLVLKNSSVEDRHPTANQLTNGEIALNYSEAGAFLSCRDTNGDIQHIGGVKIDDAPPGSPSKQALWFQPSTNKLFIYDGTGWLVAASGGSGGGGDINTVVGNDGIDANEIGGVVTLDVDINTRKGLHFEFGKLAINPGANISFDADGKLQADIDTLSYKGTVDLTSDPVPSVISAGDAFVNTGINAMTAAWQTATGLGATTVTPGDLVIKTPTAWSYIPTGGEVVQADLGIDNRGTETLDITSSIGDDVTIPAATDALAGLMTAADKATLDAGGTPNGGTGDRPASPDIGDLYFDTDLELLLVWNGTDWEPVSPPQAPGQWTRTGTKLAPINPGDTVVVTAADGTEVITLSPNGSAVFTGDVNAVEGTFTGDVNAVNGQFTGDVNAVNGQFTDDVNAVNGQFTGDVNALTGNINAVEATFTDDVNALNAVITDDISLGGGIINTTVDGDQDIICDGSGLIEVTEYNLTPMEVVTKHDIGTGANEVPLNGFLGTLAYKDDLAIQDGTTVALLPTSPTARVGNMTRVTDGAASLTWGATVTGGGTAQYLVWYNGTNWTIFGA